MRLRCPHCGLRSLEEFTYLGDATVQRPLDAPDMRAPLSPEAQAHLEAMHRYVHIRANPRGRHYEQWHHVGGCRSWIVVERDTLTHEVFNVGDARAFAAARRAGADLSAAMRAAQQSIEVLHPAEDHEIAPAAVEELAATPSAPGEPPAGRGLQSPIAPSAVSERPAARQTPQRAVETTAEVGHAAAANGAAHAGNGSSSEADTRGDNAADTSPGEVNCATRPANGVNGVLPAAALGNGAASRAMTNKADASKTTSRNGPRDPAWPYTWPGAEPAGQSGKTSRSAGSGQ